MNAHYWDALKIQGDEEPITIPSEVMDRLDIPDGEKRFLDTNGLPPSGPTFLSFELTRDRRFPVLSERWSLPKKHEKFAVIGFNGAGDPISIACDGSGRVVYHNHDAGFEEVLINSSPTALGETMKDFAEMIRKAQAVNGPDAFLDNRIPTDAVEEFRRRLEGRDKLALEAGCHWATEYACLTEQG